MKDVVIIGRVNVLEPKVKAFAITALSKMLMDMKGRGLLYMKAYKGLVRTAWRRTVF